MRTHPKSSSGFTMVEMAVSLGIFSLVILSFVSFSAHSQRSAQQAFASQEVFSKRLDAIEFIIKDFRSASRASLGSLALNGGFEKELNATTPLYWSSNVQGTGSFNYVESQSTSTVHSGFRSLSLKRTGGTEPTYDTNDFMHLSPGAAYMITAWVHTNSTSTIALVSLINNAGVSAASGSASSVPWSKVGFRYPASGLYTDGALPLNQSKIRLSITSSTGSAFFDDISCAPIYAVLVSTNPSDTNIEDTVVSTTNPFDPAGFRFSRWRDQSPELYRYRWAEGGEESRLIRERFNTATGQWEDTVSRLLAQGIEKLEFSYNDASLLPPEGKEKPLVVRYLYRDTLSKRNNVQNEWDSITVYPLAP